MTQKQYETPHIWHDLPLEDEEDAQFHFEDYAATFSRLITSKSTRTPLTIGISGAWGSGKTTLLRRVEKMLKSDDAPFLNASENPGAFRTSKTVWFDAWKYDDEDELLVALIRVILNTMRRDGLLSKFKAGWENPEESSYDFAGMLLDAFQISFGGLGFNPDLKKYETPSAFKSHTAFFDHFDEAFERLLALWVHGNSNYKEIDEKEGVLTIFIDDLDRCLPEKTVQVLEAVKLFLDKKGCVFVLGADTRIVQQAVTKHYQETNIVQDDPSDYLEKIIQLRFDLPPVKDDEMEAFVGKQVDGNGGMRAHSRLIALGAAANPRKVKTFLNDLNLRWAMWRNMADVGVVDFDDFVRWEVWMRAAPDFKKRVYGFYKPAVQAKIVGDAFEWAAGNDEAASSFKNDLNNEMRRVLEEIAPHKESFTAEVIESLVHMALPLVEEEEASGKLQEASEQVASGKFVGEGILAEKGRLRAKDAYLQDEMQEKESEFAGMIFQRVPKGEFLMGSTKDNSLAYSDEQSQHSVDIPYDYYMARFPVLNAEYGKFAGSKFKVEGGKENHPVVNVSWLDVQKYIAWLNENHAKTLENSYKFALPSEAEWEKAARGEYANEYPWGNDFDENKCNSSEGGIGTTSPVGQFSPAGDSPYGCADMVGNTWEWTRSLWAEYPYPEKMADREKREDENASGSRVPRGGSFDDDQDLARCAFRFNLIPDFHSLLIGFRICVSPVS